MNYCLSDLKPKTKNILFSSTEKLSFPKRNCFVFKETGKKAPVKLPFGSFFGFNTMPGSPNAIGRSHSLSPGGFLWNEILPHTNVCCNAYTWQYVIVVNKFFFFWLMTLLKKASSHLQWAWKTMMIDSSRLSWWNSYTIPSEEASPKVKANGFKIPWVFWRKLSSRKSTFLFGSGFLAFLNNPAVIFGRTPYPAFSTSQYNSLWPLRNHRKSSRQTSTSQTWHHSSPQQACTPGFYQQKSLCLMPKGMKTRCCSWVFVAMRGYLYHLIPKTLTAPFQPPSSCLFRWDWRWTAKMARKFTDDQLCANHSISLLVIEESDLHDHSSFFPSDLFGLLCFGQNAVRWILL